MMLTMTNRPHDPAGTVLLVVGELDTYAAEDLRQHLNRLPVEPDGRVLLDLSAVTFMSCSALRVLAGARARLGSRLTVGGRSRAVRRLLELTGRTSSFAEEAGDAKGCAADATAGTVDGDFLRTRGAVARAWTFSRTDVDRVRGLLMAVHGCDAEQAWRILALAAARHGVPVGELAQLLIRAHQQAPSPAAAAAALTALMRRPIEPAACAGVSPVLGAAGGPHRQVERLMYV